MEPLLRPWRRTKSSSTLEMTSTIALPTPTTSKLSCCTGSISALIRSRRRVDGDRRSGDLLTALGLGILSPSFRDGASEGVVVEVVGLLRIVERSGQFGVALDGRLTLAGEELHRFLAFVRRRRRAL